jgi:hypothetical protein
VVSVTDPYGRILDFLDRILVIIIIIVTNMQFSTEPGVEATMSVPA